ncbi:MAG: 4-alpha-glucanotransferase [Treponema sp.]|nr:4-alpha-glucanotransferase [Treponema sp.]
MNFSRKSGVLLHPTSLPGSAGIGTLGKSAYAFVDWLLQAGQTLWQILPLGPTGYGDSPYASFSTYAGNPLLIDFDLLAMNQRATPEMIVPPDYIKTEGPVDFGAVVYWKNAVLKQAAAWFLKHGSKSDVDSYKKFTVDNAFWLDDYAAFMTIKEHYDVLAQEQGCAGIWHSFWPKELGAHDLKAVQAWSVAHADAVEVIKVIQYFFFDQWHALKAYANRHCISIIGDIPIFVAPDSSDVWAHQSCFQVDEHGVPKAVAGVPPDYFSATGQLWGNPLYDWDTMKADGYQWWIARIRHMLQLVDYVRIDHFRGFEAYWSVPYGEQTAVHGTWIKGPGYDLFAAIKKELGDIPVIAEDLGVITDEVRDLRDKCEFPGMKVLQFAFSPDEAKQAGMVNAFLPHTFTGPCIAYTGTHDNQTMQGWLCSASDKEVQLVASYCAGEAVSIADARAQVANGTLCKKLVALVFASTACFALIPLQDVFAIGDEGRMNMPSTTGSNWSWRVSASLLTDAEAQKLHYLSYLYGRNIKKGEK